VTAETARDRNRRLYGRPRVPRGHRRVMLALLAADGLSFVQLYRLAQARAGTVTAVLDALEDLRWLNRDRPDVLPGYTLNGEGRAGVRLLLGLPAETARPAPEET
jgi:hypothetical protein